MLVKVAFPIMECDQVTVERKVLGHEPRGTVPFITVYIKHECLEPHETSLNLHPLSCLSWYHNMCLI